MNILEKLLPWSKSDELESAESDPQRPARNHGPVKTRPITNGQIRRSIMRQQKTAQRKVQIAHRRRWMDNRHSVAVLRGQLQAVGEIPYADGTFADGKAAAARKGLTIEDVLCERYGSVERARQQYDAIMAEAR